MAAASGDRDSGHRPAVAAVPLQCVLDQALRQADWRSPAVNAEIKALVSRMVAANPLWGAPRIHAELISSGPASRASPWAHEKIG
jgi:hypothetical protein